MPTKPRKPQWNVDSSRAGYSPLMPLYNPDQTAELAAELRRSPEEIEKRLNLAALEIGPFISEPEATEPQQWRALSCLAGDAKSLLNGVKGLDPRSRLRLLSEYGAEGDSEGDALLALSCLAQDVTALDRLYQNLMIATRRLSPKAKGKPGAPTISFERFAAEKLLRVCRDICGSAYLQPRSAERKASQRFVIRALLMIGVAQSTARTAANDALVNAEKLPDARGIKLDNCPCKTSAG